MRRRRKQQQVGCRLRKGITQLEAGDLLGAAADAMGLVDDDQVPSGRDQVFEPFAVVAGELLLAPAAAGVDRLHRVERADDLIVHAPEVLVLVDGARLTECAQAAGKDEPEVLVEVALHLRLPLQHQSRRSDDEDPPHKPANLQLAQDQTGLDRLAEPHLVRQQIADAIAGDGALQSEQLVGQRDDRAFQRSDQRVPLQRVGDARGGADIGKAVEEMRLARFQRGETLLQHPDGSPAARQPDQAGRLSPQRVGIDDAAGFIMVDAVPPLARLHASPHSSPRRMLATS